MAGRRIRERRCTVPGQSAELVSVRRALAVAQAWMSCHTRNPVDMPPQICIARQGTFCTCQRGQEQNRQRMDKGYGTCGRISAGRIRRHPPGCHQPQIRYADLVALDGSHVPRFRVRADRYRHMCSLCHWASVGVNVQWRRLEDPLWEPLSVALDGSTDR